MKIYIIGSLRNENIPDCAEILEDQGHEVFADWFSPGPEADQYWHHYEQLRGRGYLTAINGPHAEHVFNFDKKWLDWADAAVLVLPAGKSAHLELGYIIGKGKKGYVLFNEGEPERWDLMYRFAIESGGGIFLDIDDLLEALR